MGASDIKPYEFKEGQSGNPNGRPEGSRNRSTIAKEVLSLQIDVRSVKSKKTRDALESLGLTGKVSVETIITIAQAAVAANGNTLAYQAIMDSAHGKPKQTTEQHIVIPIEEIEVIHTDEKKDKDNAGA